MNGHGTRVGAMFRCAWPPELLPGFAAFVEDAGYDELWIVEDCFYASAVPLAAAALATTRSLRVGIGVLPVVLRNPALTAMELAALDRLYPGRLMAGLGHGVADWMRQVGAYPSSPLAALDETLRVVRALLDGQEVSLAGRHVSFDRVRLDQPPIGRVPLYAGVGGPRSLALSGAVADGTILAECSSPGYVAWAREQIAAARTADLPQHRITVYTLLGTGDAEAETRTAVAAALLDRGPALGLDAELRDRVETLATAQASPELLGADLPDAYLDGLCVRGSAEQSGRQLAALAAAGADCVVLVASNTPDVAREQLDEFARRPGAGQTSRSGISTFD
jgi:5,10-methylenetetrahydromethanopterin reductase